MATEMTATTLSFLGKILCCPPIVNSPKGKPQATSAVIVAITPNNTAPNIESINQYPPFAKYKKFQQAVACVPTNRVSDCALHYLRAATNFKTDVRGVCDTHTRIFCRSNYCFKLSDGLKCRLKTSWHKGRLKTVNPFSDGLCFISGNEYNNA